MNRRTLIPILALMLSTSSLAPGAELAIPDFKSLEHKATDSVNITLGPWLLQMAGRALDDADPDGASVKRLLSGITSTQIRSFQFDRDFAYSEADIDAVRAQLSAPGWTQLVKVRNRNDRENVDISILVDRDRTHGFALVATKPREFTIVSIVGSVELDGIPRLAHHLHLPTGAVDDALPEKLAAAHP